MRVFVSPLKLISYKLLSLISEHVFYNFDSNAGNYCEDLFLIFLLLFFFTWLPSPSIFIRSTVHLPTNRQFKLSTGSGWIIYIPLTRSASMIIFKG